LKPFFRLTQPTQIYVYSYARRDAHFKDFILLLRRLRQFSYFSNVHYVDFSHLFGHSTCGHQFDENKFVSIDGAAIQDASNETVACCTNP